MGMDVREDARQQAVAGHGEPDARLADLEDEDGGDHAQSAPSRTTSRTQWRGWPPGKSESFLSALTTGAASPTMDCHGTSR